MQAPAAPTHPKRFSTSSPEQTKERLLEAAAWTFSREGIQGATTRQIAREAGVNEVTLFRHFKSKEQLLEAVLKRGLASEIALMNEHSPGRRICGAAWRNTPVITIHISKKSRDSR